MNYYSLEERRSAVNRLLNECVDQKLLCGGTANAITKARNAYAFATSEPQLPSPWPQLAAYRLAHLSMRTDDLRVESLREIDRLFSEASYENRLGPLPPIYHLAILSRLKLALKERSEKYVITAKINKAFERAVHEIRQTHFSSSQLPEQPVTLQSAAFNLMELACYFLGMPYRELEGLAALDYLDPLRSGRWFIVGRGIERIFMTEELARWEFESRARTGENILIELKEGFAKWGLSSNARDGLQEVNADFAKLVLLSLEPALSSKEIKQRIVGNEGEDPNARFRTIKKRTKDALQLLTTQPGLEVFVGERLTDAISILGLVHSPAFY
jgi:hypothetical protein